MKKMKSNKNTSDMKEDAKTAMKTQSAKKSIAMSKDSAMRKLAGC